MNKEEIINYQESDLSIKEIIEFTSSNNIVVSNEYADFLIFSNNGSLRHHNILLTRTFNSGSKQDFYLGEFLTFNEFKESYTYFHSITHEEDLVEAKVTIIGRTNGRTSICIGFSEVNLGQIFLWDGDFGVTKQSENLQLFLDSLALDETV